MTKSNHRRQSRFAPHAAARQKALIAAIRAAIAGGVFAHPAAAEPLPVPVQSMENLGRLGNVNAALNDAGNKMTINQLTSRAIIDWKSFDIDAGYAVQFKQPNAAAVALNNIRDGNPSQIYGSLSANGQIYLVNQNGFVFGKGSQVNVSALVATTLGISDDAFRRGITKVFDQTGDAALKGNGELFLKDELGNYILDKNQQKVPIRIYVQEGATITGAKDAKGAIESGNRVILAAPVVDMRGTIKTPEGQTILAAAQDRVYLQEANGDPDLRGLLVEVGTGGTVENVGKVLADRGNASLIGFAVNQNGLVSATSSVSLNGSVRLLAREGVGVTEESGKYVFTGGSNERGEGAGKQHATVRLGVGSVTQVLPDADKSATAVDAQDQPRSRIEIEGHRVLARSGAVIRATSGDIDIKAPNLKPTNEFDGRIYLEKGSVVDASGLRNVELAMNRNVLEVELRKNELRDSPLQRDGILYAKTVKVDLRDVDENGRIPIADVSGAVNRIRRNIDERSTAGGTVNLTADGDTIVKSGATIDVSGGSVAYKSGNITTTRLTADGKSYDIGNADAKRTYTGMADQRHFEKGYVEGKAGGSLNISGNSVLVDGSLKGSTVRGPHQRGSYDAGFKTNPFNQAEGSELSIRSANDIVLDRLKLATGMTEIDAFPIAGGQPAPLVLGTDMLNGSGFRDVTLATGGRLTVTRGSRVELPVTGSLTLQAGAVNVEGQIQASSGTVAVQPNTTGGGFHLGRDASIDVRGLWVNDKLPNGSAPLALDGGRVSVSALNADLVLEKGSRILADGGARLDPKGKLTAGEGGDISLVAQGDSSNGPQDLVLAGELSSYGISRGGSLTLRSAEVVIGNDLGAVATRTDSPLFLRPAFFRSGGFSSFDVGSDWYRLTVASGTQLLPSMLNRILTASAAAIPSAANIAGVSEIGSLPDAVRKPVDLFLSALQPALTFMDQVLTVGEGARIKTEPGGSVTLNSDSSIHLNGRIQTSGGDIALNINPVNQNGYFASQGIWLGASSSLDASGVYQPKPNDLGLRQGEVFDGGDVTLTAARGYIVAEQGSRIQSNGTAAVLDLPVSLGSSKTVPKAVGSDGGRIGLIAAEGLLLDGSLSAKGGGKKGAGGELTVVLDQNLRGKNTFPDQRTRGGELFPDDDLSDPQFPIDLPVPRVINVIGSTAIETTKGLRQGDAISDELYGTAWLSSPQIVSGGFSSVTLQAHQPVNGTIPVGEIRFHGDVNLFAERQIVLDAPQLGWTADGGQDQGQVAVQAAYVALGASRFPKEGPTAVAGNGKIDVTAKGIELIGGLSLQGVNRLGLNSTGDVRARGIRDENSVADRRYEGTLKLAGDLHVRADQVYPATLSQYTIDAGAGKVTIEGTGDKRAPVYSAGGALTIKAREIHQNGVLKAPFGQLNLNAEDLLQLGKGSITSVSGAGAMVPFGRVQGGIDWVFPLLVDGSQMLVFEQLPAKKITLKGDRVDLAEGSKVNLNGGGNLTAYEWIKGPGGSVDVLDPASEGFQQKFAVMPGYTGLMTAYDPSEFEASGLQVGDRVYLAGGSGLPAGWYTLLPAHYALLPGAYLVTPQTDTIDIAPGQSFINQERATVVAGRYGAAGTGIADARWNGFAVERGSIVKTRAEYDIFQANQFYAGKGGRAGQVIPNQPRDAGDLVLSAAASLSLAGDVQTVAYGRGAGGHMDIQADRLAVVTDPNQAQAPGVVTLLASDLNALNVSSILLGGERTRQTGGNKLTVGASSVTVAGGAHLKNGEVILAATDRVTVESGAVVESSGSGGSSDGLTVSNAVGGSDGALLRVSSAGQAVVMRDQEVNGVTGVLEIAQGARLQSAGSVLLDSTRDTLLEGDLAMNGGALALHAVEISLGEVPAGSSGLVLSNAQLAGLRVNQLELTSRSDLNLYGSVDLQALAPSSGASSLAIDAAAIKGYGDGSSRFAADHVVFANGGAQAGSDAATGIGSLELRAGRDLVLGSGDYSIAGFERVTLRSEGALKGLGRAADGRLADPGTLTVGADLELAAAAITGDHGATTTVNAVGYDIRLSTLVGDADGIGLGVSWTLDADSIQGSGNFLLPSGILQLRARQGDVSLADGTVVDVSGLDAKLGPVTRYSDAGSILMQADHGNLSLAEGASLNLKGAQVAKSDAGQTSDAGRLTLSAAEGRVDWNGTVSANAGDASAQGILTVDARDFGGFATLNGKLKAAGFSESVELRQREGDVTIAETDELRAHRFGLIADQGAVTIAGTIDASGAEGGSVAIAGRNGITLAATGLISAKATAADGSGGSVRLDTVHGDDAGSGVLDLSAASDAGKGIDVSAGNGGQTGEVHLRTGRDAAGAVALRDSAVNTRITGVDRVALEATRVYHSDGVITAEAIQGWKDDTAAFMAAAPAISSASAAVTLMPGVEVRSAGSLDLQTDWDLVSWRYGENGTPGILTLKATDDLDLHGSLSDGFAAGNIGTTTTAVENLLQPGNSWSYNLVAGNDVNLWPNIQVRTGTGDISIEAGGNVAIKAEQSADDRAAVVYTMGRPADGGTDADYADQRYGNLHDQTVAARFYAEYPIDGGDISIRAGGDVVREINMNALPAQQLITEWLARAGNWSADAGGIPSMWGINIGDGAGRSFHQDVGALGGGDVTVAAGGSVQDLSVVIPTTGKPVGETTLSGSGPRLSQTFQTNEYQIQGGGDLAVSAGKDILGGFYYAEQGRGVLTAGGSIGVGYLGAGVKASPDGGTGYDDTGMGPVLALGDAQFRLDARRDLTIAAAFNPGLLFQNPLSTMNGGTQSFAITYGAASSVDFHATAGDLVLQNNFQALAQLKGRTDVDNDKLAMSIYPGTVTGTALQGDVEVQNSFNMMPANQGQLELLAGSDLRLGTADSSAAINMSDTDPSLLPSLQAPVDQITTNTRLQGRFDVGLNDVNLLHAAIPVHQANPAGPSSRRDRQPVRLVAASGDLAFLGGASSTVYLPKPAEIYAGRDIVNLNLRSQNLGAGDITRIEAGRDIVYPTSRNTVGALQNQDNQAVELGGPGELQLVAGRDIDLGASKGVLTLGGLLNSAFADLPGAGVSALAGFRLKPKGYDDFIEAYIQSGKYSVTETDENGEPVTDTNGDPVLLKGQEAADHLKALPEKRKLKPLLAIMYREVAKAANAAAHSGRKEDYQPGYDAIAALFDVQAAQGDIKMFFSQIKTAAGGDINLAAPGGLVNAGLSGSVAGSRTAEQLGVVVAREGRLNAVTDGDFMVNESRVFTMDGGDILIWSSHGDIDAGRGAKSAISAPSPTTTIDANGNVQIDFPPAISGSGIQAIASGGGKAGKVILAAPAGVVNAGEAGIVGGQVVIAATAVIGASNIQSTSGPSIGVPTAVAPPVVPAGADSAAASAAKSATSMDQGGDQKVADAEERGKQAAVSILSVDVVGYGSCTVSEVREGKEDCAGG